ncbi:unnamed protein product [Brassicogethes aeneus]|uniref:Transposase n=1 Tax=Brassicogethes aeneus TaxID=1431903 RepID=A0A9P0B8S4_BRAAE|nr:unnamed protein product [Brassicogethes aeneus]
MGLLVKSVRQLFSSCSKFRDECLSKTQVYEWCSAFRKGREVVANLPHARRRPRTSVTDDNVSTVENLILEDRRSTVRDMAEELGISVGSNLLKNTVKPAYRSKRRDIPIRSETLNELGWETLEDPPYSPDLSPRDYYLFGPLKEALGGLQSACDSKAMLRVRMVT